MGWYCDFVGVLFVVVLFVVFVWVMYCVGVGCGVFVCLFVFDCGMVCCGC